MAKESFADKMARKAFEKPETQRSWQVHMAAFGPVLEHAFEEDYQARIHLIAALNHISRRELQPGLKKLELLRKRIANNSDQAALVFFVGLCFDLAGQNEQMLLYYTAAAELGLRFYMPYIKMAKFYQNGHLYDRAEENYLKAVSCFDGTGLRDQDKLILGSAYAGAATCRTMMHKYEEAEKLLSVSRQLWPDGPGRSAVEAVLYAALSQPEKVEAALDVLKHHAPQAHAELSATAAMILAGEEPMFAPVPVDQEKLHAFWDWFAESQDMLLEAGEDCVDLISPKLNETFPVGEGELEAARDAEGTLYLQHVFSVALEDGFQKLMACAPSCITEKWHFEIVPYYSRHNKP